MSHRYPQEAVLRDGRVLTPDAYIAHDDISRKWANGTLRVTTRQDFQMHGVL